MQSSNPESFRSCHRHHSHPPLGFIFIPLFVVFFFYEPKFHFFWPVIIFMIFLFFIALHRTRYTYHRGSFDNNNNNYQNDYFTVNYPYYHNPQGIKPNYCKNCGTVIEQDSKYCSECGNKLF